MPLGSGRYRSYGPPPPLLDPDTLPFPGALVRECKGCGLSAKCRAPVPGENINPDVDVMFVGQNPGRAEDQNGRPFIGAAGEYLDSLLFQARIPRDSVAIVNLVKCLTPGNRQPSPAEIKACSKWLDLEVETVDPYIIVTMGVPATRHFLGPDCGSMEQLNGKPIQLNGRVILPMYHPAAALHDTAKLRHCSVAFESLQGLMEGATWRAFRVRDEYPNPDYRVADTPELLKKMRDEAIESGEFGLDTEQCRGKPWSYQVSAQPGTAWFVPLPDNFKGRVDFTDWSATAIVHFYLHDIQYVALRDHGYIDSMCLAYLTGEPQGLKELGHRLCGVQMQSYKDITRPGQQALSLDYLLKALRQDWPDPPPIEETKWDNKKGEIITREKHPWHISRKVSKMLDDLGDDPSVDLWDRWRNIPVEERWIVESVLGEMPESSLADIPRDQAIAYASRDADITLRVKHKLAKIIEKLGLEFVQYTDLGILPMVNAMMANGMAIDLDHYRRLSEDYDHRLRLKAAELAAMVGHSFNPNSSQQTAVVVYTELGFKPTKTTSTGLISTDDAELKKTGHPVAEEIIRYRGILKLKSTYADNMISSARPDQDGVPRIHTKINTTRVETGRLSSAKLDDGTGMNLQTIPTRSKEARAIKSGIIAPSGKILLEGDLGQIEMRTQAHLANCKGLIELFLSGADPHTTTAARLFNVPYEEAGLNKYRYPTKRAGFGIIYMIGAHGLSTQINEYIADLKMDGEPVDIEPWDEEQCGQFIEEYYRLYPEIRDYQHQQLIHARRRGYVQDMFGRIRYIPEVSCPIRSVQEAGARQAANFAVTACLPVDTKVTTKRGWIPIGEFVDGEEVWTGEKWARAERLPMGVHPRVRLYLSDGRTFDCDVNHKLLVRNGLWPEWRGVLDMRPDDKLATDWSTDWGVPVGSEEDWYWAGRFIGDGWLSSPTAKIRFWGMAFGSKEVQDGDRLMKWLDTKNINGHTSSKTGYYPHHDHRGNFKIGGGTKAGYALWLSLGMQQKKAREKRMPDVVFTLDYPRRLAFLNGYTDADGRSSRRGWQLCSSSHGLMEDTVRLAASLGYSAWIRKPQTRTFDWPSKIGRGRIYTSTLWYCDILQSRRDVFVTRAEILPLETMYTLSVDDERHAFASEGLISKNSAQGIIKAAMVELWDGLPATPWSDAKAIMQVHDSLLYEVQEDPDYVREFIPWVKGIMTGVVKLSVPIEVDFKYGKRWGEMEKYGG